MSTKSAGEFLMELEQGVATVKQELLELQKLRDAIRAHQAVTDVIGGLEHDHVLYAVLSDALPAWHVRKPCNGYVGFALCQRWKGHDGPHHAGPFGHR